MATGSEGPVATAGLPLVPVAWREACWTLNLQELDGGIKKSQLMG